MITISIANRKGGVGKTTSCINIAYELNRKGYKTLVLDLDDQCDTSKVLIGEVDSEANIQGVLEGAVSIEDSIYIIDDCLEAISGSRDISHLTEESIVINLVASIECLREEYDFVIIDHPPNMNEASIQGFVASDYVVIVTDVEAFALTNLSDILDDVEAIRYEMNNELNVLGVVANKVDFRRNLSKSKLLELQSTIGEELFKTYVSYDSGIPTSHNQKVPVRKIHWKSRTAAQYSKIADEILERIGE